MLSSVLFSLGKRRTAQAAAKAVVALWICRRNKNIGIKTPPRTLCLMLQRNP